MDTKRIKLHPEGLYYYKNFLSKQYEKKLVKYIYDNVWGIGLSRRVQHYGYKYDYSIREPQTKKLKKTEIPELFKCLADVLHDHGVLHDYPNQIIINEYEPGQGISAHRDHHPIFGYDVATLSLLSGLEMKFEPHRLFKKELGDDKKTMYLERGSLLVFGGDARMKYTHEIPKRKSDPSPFKTGPKRLRRAKRISVTFRHVNTEYREE